MVIRYSLFLFQPENRGFKIYSQFCIFILPYSYSHFRVEAKLRWVTCVIQKIMFNGLTGFTFSRYNIGKSEAFKEMFITPRFSIAAVFSLRATISKR